jgi:hypothetical protein
METRRGTGHRFAVLISMVVLAMVATVGFAPVASAAYSPTPMGPSRWVPDGPVHAVVASGSRVFVGGSFTGGVAALDAGTGALLWTGTANGGVRALAVSPDGTHLIAGGGFSQVDGVTHRKLASLLVTTGKAEPNWKAAAGGLVRDIVVSGGTAYFAGAFTKHNGLTQGGLGAVSVSTGKVVPGFTASTDAKVFGLATNGSKLVVAGGFTTVNGQPRSSLASITLATNTLDAWNPTRPCAGCNLYWDVVLNGSTVYAVGRNAGAVTAVDLTTAARRWRVTANGDAQALVLSGGLLYVGGHFSEIGNPRVPRKIMAALNPATGAVDPGFTARFVTSYPGIWALAATTSRLYVGGHFTAAGPRPNRFPYFAMFASS